MAIHVDQYFSNLFCMPTHFQSTQMSVAHWLRNDALSGIDTGQFEQKRKKRDIY